MQEWTEKWNLYFNVSKPYPNPNPVVTIATSGVIKTA